MAIKIINGHYRNYINSNCIVCNKEFEHRKDYNTKYCSPKCSRKVLWANKEYRDNMVEKHKGYKMPEEQKQKMSITHKERYKDLSKEQRLRMLEKAIRANSLEKGECAFNKLYRDYQTHSKERKLVFNINKDTFRKIVTSNCKYCGITPSTRKDYGKKQNINGAFYYNGIDRIDSNIGYIDGNIIPCCKVCNYAKRNMSIYEWTQWLKRINDNLFNKNNIIEITKLGTNNEYT